jgi:heavy metal translocating P-type ATPase
MHDGHHEALAVYALALQTPRRKNALDWAQYAVKYLFPAGLLVMILLSLVPALSELAKFDVAMVPMLIGGGYITYSTILVTIEKKKITAGMMVVLALIGTSYVGEYLAGAIVAFMMIGGEFLEDVTLEKTRNAVRELIRLAPGQAAKKTGQGFITVPIGEVASGDIVLVKPGERIPVDGVIVHGQAAVNESSLTGESMPVDKTVDDTVYTGTINTDGVLEIRVDKTGEDTTLGKIIRVVQEAQENKGVMQKTADKFAAYFTPAVLLICTGVWFGTYELLRVMSVLVIACPCALVLATPTAVVASVGNIAKRGGLIKGGITLETAGKVTALCLDKTGTITRGKPQVVEVKSFSARSLSEIVELAAIAEKFSQHPIAHAIMEHHLKLFGAAAIPSGQNFQMLFGRGVRIDHDDREIEVSNRTVLADENIETAPEVGAFLQKQDGDGRTALLVVAGGQVLGGIAVADTIRFETRSFIEKVRRAGIERIIMLTGDNPQTARAIANQAGIAEFRACLLPEDKLDIIRDLQQQGEIVGMIGDGVNDAPALILADVGIAMGIIGTDVAIESSDIALMADNLLLVPDILVLSRRALGIIKQNIWVFAAGVNVVGISLASSGWLSPIAAAVVHNIASVMVVMNSARLLTYRYQ